MFVVYDDLGATITPDTVLALEGTTLPKRGDEHPNVTGLYAIDRPFLDYDPGMLNNQMRVEYVYANSGIISSTSSLPEEEGYVEAHSEIVAEFEEVWVEWGSVDLTSAGVTNGDGIPKNGKEKSAALSSPTFVAERDTPGTRLRRKQRLVISEILFGTSDRWFLETPKWGTYRSQRGTRNDRSFFGAAAGKVLYLGASVATAGHRKVRVTHEFEEDEFFHLYQFPKRKGDGEVSPSTATSQTWNAEEVYLVQPFLNTSNFNLLSDYWDG